jgi:anti-anti-sigma regulatory factor
MTRKNKLNEKLLKAEKEFTHQNALVMADTLNSALKKGVHAKIVLTGISSVDLSSLQLIISARKSFAKGKIPLSVDFNCTDEVGALLENCGFGKLLNLKD